MSDWVTCKRCDKPIIEGAAQWQRDQGNVCVCGPLQNVAARPTTGRGRADATLAQGARGLPTPTHPGGDGSGDSLRGSGALEPARASRLEDKFAEALAQYGQDLPPPDEQYPPLRGRAFRIDFAWPDVKLAVEVVGGAHGIEKRRRQDASRNNALVEEDWRLLYFTAADLKDPEKCVQTVRKVRENISAAHGKTGRSDT